MSDMTSRRALDDWMIKDSPRAISQCWTQLTQETEAKGRHEQWMNLFKTLVEHLRMCSEGSYAQHRAEEGVDEEVEAHLERLVEETGGHESLGHTFATRFFPAL